MALAEIVGPFDVHHICYDGHRVPHIAAHRAADGRYHLVVDSRFGTNIALTQDELDNIMPILANAMAVAAGYSCFGAQSKPLNRFAIGMSQMTTPAPRLTIVPESPPSASDPA